MLRTERLILRDWRDSDLDPFAAMGQDHEVMAHFPELLSRDDSAAGIERCRARIARDGFGMWAVEVPGAADFIGFCGIQRVPFEASFTPAVEIGWRLARDAWGHGYATEAARASLAFGWQQGLDEIVAMLVPTNRRSAAVAERIGMTLSEYFDHPTIEQDVSVGGWPIRQHALYRIRRQSAPVQLIEAAKS